LEPGLALNTRDSQKAPQQPNSFVDTGRKKHQTFFQFLLDWFGIHTKRK
jgi:hypothetical protein